MCGIVGIWTNQQDQDRIRQEITEAVARLRHRGPDDEGIWVNGRGLALGHTRLSILDLSDLGHQPMFSSDGRNAIVFNGEIYNFAEIRSRLAKSGHSFSGTGDTEVILHAFKEWGSDAVKQFVGMFAIAWWDAESERLELLRDRVGVKPLHFGWDGTTLCFGSELKALREFKHWTPEIDLRALGEFLQYGYIAEDRTIYKSVFKLKPGHRLLLEKGRQPVVEPYWSATDGIDFRSTVSDLVIESELEELLISSFRYRMVSDVPVGVYLSGGVDSSLVTAILAKHHDRQIHTFTIGFSEDTHDESRFAKKVASHCGTNHTEYILTVKEGLEIAKGWGQLFDEPFGDSSGIPTLLVSRLASEKVKVVLSADGGDELFSGYNVYGSVLQRMKQLDRLPRWLSKGMSTSVATFSQSGLGMVARNSLRGKMRRRIQNLEAMLKDPTAGRLMDLRVSYWQPDEIELLLGKYRSPRHSANSYTGEPSLQLSLWDFQHYLPEDILTKVDRTTMAASIEGREPLLDHRLVEYALGLPPHLKRGALGPKHLLKSILYRYVPRELVDRPKQGFAIPLTRWLRSELRELVNDYLGESRIQNAGIMDTQIVRQSIKRFEGGDTKLASHIWFLLAFEMWRESWG